MKKLLLLSAFLLMFDGPAYALCVKVSSANLRSGPGTGYEKTWMVYKYMPFRELSHKGNWYKVKDLEGDIHWIHESLVDSTMCAVVKAQANIRTGPGKQHEKASHSPGLKYHSFKVLKIEGSWAKVEDENGDAGWIFRKLLWIQ
jgi:SH3-like domain-containing protein